MKSVASVSASSLYFVCHAWIVCHIKKLGEEAKLTFTAVQNLLGTVAGHPDAWRVNGGPS